jgi:hypothetical protein
MRAFEGGAMITTAWAVAVNDMGTLRPVDMPPLTWSEANRATRRLNRLASEIFAHVVPYGALDERRATGRWRAAKVDRQRSM